MHRPIRPPTWKYVFYSLTIKWEIFTSLPVIWILLVSSSAPYIFEINYIIHNTRISSSPWELIYCSLLEVEGYNGYISVKGIIRVISWCSKHSWFPLLEINVALNGEVPICLTLLYLDSFKMPSSIVIHLFGDIFRNLLIWAPKNRSHYFSFEWMNGITCLHGDPFILIDSLVFIEDRCCPDWWVHILESIFVAVHSSGSAKLVQSQGLDVTSIKWRSWDTWCVLNFITVRQTVLWFLTNVCVLHCKVLPMLENTWHRFVGWESIMLLKSKAS